MTRQARSSRSRSSPSRGRTSVASSTELIEHLRQLLLVQHVGHVPESLPVTEETRERLREQANQLPEPTVLRLIDLLAVAVDDMRQGGDPRLPLELALVKVTRPQADLSRDRSPTASSCSRHDPHGRRPTGAADGARRPPSRSRRSRPSDAAAAEEPPGDGATRRPPTRSRRSSSISSATPGGEMSSTPSGAGRSRSRRSSPKRGRSSFAGRRSRSSSRRRPGSTALRSRSRRT